MRRDHELTTGPNELVNTNHQGQLSLRRQGCLGLVEHEQPTVPELVDRDPEERLAVRHFVKVGPAVRSVLFGFSRDVEHRFCAQKEPGLLATCSASEPDMALKRGLTCAL